MKKDVIVIGMLEVTYNYLSDFKVYSGNASCPTLRAQGGSPIILTEGECDEKDKA